MKRRVETQRDESVEASQHSSEGEEPGSEEGGKACDVCREVPDSIIYLSCDHILCLVCIARILVGETDGAEEVDISEVACSRCGQTTVLSKEVQDTLFEFLSQEELGGEESVSAAGRNGREEPVPEASGEEAEEEAEEEAAEPPAPLRPAESRERLKRAARSERALSHKDSTSSRFRPPPALLCQVHEGEEYVYYHNGAQRLLCAHCLISEPCDEKTLAELRPVKRCLPQILQGFEQLHREAAIQSQLVANRRHDLELRRENCRGQSQAHFKRLALALDEIIELAGDLKLSCAKEFEARIDGHLAALDGLDDRVLAHARYFEEVLREAEELAAGGEEGREGYFAFFFGNQERVREVIAESEREAKTPAAQAAFDEVERKVRASLAEVSETAARAINERIQAKLSALAPRATEPVFPAAHREQGTPKPVARPRALHPKNPSVESHSAKSDSLSAFGQTNPNLFARPGRGCAAQERASSQRSVHPSTASHRPAAGECGDAAGRLAAGRASQRPNPYLSRLDLEVYTSAKKRELETKLRMFDLRDSAAAPLEPSNLDRFFKSCAPPGRQDQGRARQIADELIQKYRTAPRAGLGALGRCL